MNESRTRRKPPSSSSSSPAKKRASSRAPAATQRAESNRPAGKRPAAKRPAARSVRSETTARAAPVRVPAPPLTPAQRQALKGEAHALQPVAMIGSKGLSPAVLAEIDTQLSQHALIKIKAASDEREEREAWLAEVCAQLEAAPVQHIGKVLLIYRPKPILDVPPPPKKQRPADKPTPQERRMAAAGITENIGRSRLGRKAPGFKSSDRREDDRFGRGYTRASPKAGPPRHVEVDEYALDNPPDFDAADAVAPAKTRPTTRTPARAQRSAPREERPLPKSGGNMRRRRVTES
jgi:RNA-binding protein